MAGGSLLSGTLDSDTGLASPDKQGQANAAKGMRVAGSVVFYIMTSIFYGCLVHVIYTKGRRRSSSSSSYSSCLGIHPTLAILIVVSCFLFVRGIFGVLQAAVDSVSSWMHALREEEESLRGPGFPGARIERGRR